MRIRSVLAFAVFGVAFSAFGDDAPPIEIKRASGPISVDGSLSDPAWKDAVRIDKWYETNPGDNIEPKAKSVGYLTYDDKFLYAGFEFEDPNPSQIRAPYNDRDNIGGNTDDYAGIILDTRNDRKTAVLLLANPRGIQYDAVSDDASGEDSAPDLYWDASTKIHDKGWTLEMRVPFSSLRYEKSVQEWGIMLYRNWPRDRRYQMFANRLPRGKNCFICSRTPLVGLRDLPSGGNLVMAPYITGRALGETRNGLGSSFVNHPAEGDGGLDMKWTPNADTAIDATLNPDFSQIESDVAAISTNERFAIFFDEKRPFFLEGKELFKTPIQAVYTRTITSPRWGARATGKKDRNAYTLLITQDRGGGSVILPSREGSDFADQDFSSTVAIGRVRRDFGKSFVSFLGSARQIRGGGHNRVFGPDFEWRINDHHSIVGQLLYSSTKTPNRPLLADEWNGQDLSSHAAHFWWSHSTRTRDAFVEFRDFGEEFRADNGFVPQVGYRSLFTEEGRTWRPTKGFFNRLRLFGVGQYDEGQDGALLFRLISAGIAGDGRYQSFIRLRYAHSRIRSDKETFLRHQLFYNIEGSPSRLFSRVALGGSLGQDVDFTNSRLGRGANISLTGTVRPTDHLQLELNNSLRWLDIPAADRHDRLFTAQVERLKATYTFNSKMFIRTILQNTRTNRDQPLYLAGANRTEVDRYEGAFSSQLLFAYKLNWQTVLFVGYGDLREATIDQGELMPSNRQFFLKLSYAFQQ